MASDGLHDLIRAMLEDTRQRILLFARVLRIGDGSRMIARDHALFGVLSIGAIVFSCRKPYFRCQLPTSDGDLEDRR